MPPSQRLQPPSDPPQALVTPLTSSDQGQVNDSSRAGSTAERDPKTGKRKYFGLGKKGEGQEPEKSMAMPKTSLPPTHSSMGPPSPGKTASDLKPNPYPQHMPASPSRHRLRSNSPRLHSPASTEIFERSVQEPVQMSTLQGEDTEAHIPSHVITEDHIPPALEASVQAITSEELNPDEVEIVTSASHQPAASTIEGSSSHADLTQLHAPLAPLQHARSEDSEHTSIHQTGVIPSGTEDDGASNYGQLDPNDVRRLSFISFADVVQSEHQQLPGSAMNEAGHRDSLHIASLPGSFRQERAASPLRSPRSTQSRSMSGGGVTTPPAGVNVNSADNDQSPSRSAGLASPMSPPSDLNIQTMRQAVRKTASGDLSGGRSTGMSPVSDEQLPSGSRSRTGS
ncbi:hypothetical protein LTR37_016739 [Vermiconidia calcicola]|uniref:Uncharacterized protein n=1 Tax=Vermiconidia calcicola TaxID=1690605 RepID=A0ACC3MNE0_9PEZI|nr:hypothetical protein LTR37_016739 [Vermiconidia calcicola]